MIFGKNPIHNDKAFELITCHTLGHIIFNTYGKNMFLQKYILLYECRQNQKKNNFQNQSFEILNQPRLKLMLHVSSALERTMYDFKNSFFPNFLLIHRAKYIFSIDMFCVYHFKAKIHGVSPSTFY